MIEARAATSTIPSVPALALALHRWRQRIPPPPVEEALKPPALAPMYRLSAGSVAEEARAAAQLTAEVAERMRRLTRAYGEWRVFEPGPYFDLTPRQVELLTHIVERVSTVHVVFYIDALLPAFQAVQNYAAEMAPNTGSVEQIEMVHETLLERWRRLLEVIDGARLHLVEDVNFLGLSGAREEQERWLPMARVAGLNGSADWLLAGCRTLPSLTLSIEFPLPAFRQPGRKRRLMRTWRRLYGRSSAGGY
ncbi:hypothetical protein [Caldilinea sp.]|uniref:hypothetical protein n=1 Tax=Caldilinea sp. TaxID=2293560 RepID=UPI0021DF1DF7|nr:hypothetical protein [Caldilinea sp.]GIV68518.1 MAG: hypothetical protein KatS3mg048_1380 [Caldilinea sp.]